MAKDRPLKIDVPFEDALRRILKAGPMPKKRKPAKRIKKSTKRR